ncbi:glycosyltransferase family A protein [Marinobacteraceae bacterium S3BR75-40.1]
MADVSVIVPLYNRADVVAGTIDSILSQDFDGEVEIIVVDDGSTDNAAQTVPSRYPQITYLQKNNGGVSSARNYGMAKASGRYIAFLDSDDLFEPDKLSTSIELLEQEPESGFVFTDFSRFNIGAPDHLFEKTNSFFFKRIYSYCFEHNQIGEKAYLLSQQDVLNLLVEGYFMSPCTLVLRKELTQHTLQWPEHRSISEDFQFFLGLAQQVGGIYIDHPQTRVGRGADNLSMNHLACHEADVEVLKELIASKAQDPGFRKFVKRNLSRRLCGLAWNYRVKDYEQKAKAAYLESYKLSPGNFRPLVGYLRTLVGAKGG